MRQSSYYMINAVTRPCLNEVVIEELRQLISSQKLHPGDRLPTEEELARRFGVSRMSIREATKTLAFFGIVRSAPKRGLSVGHIDLQRLGTCFDFHILSTNYSNDQLLSTRMIIEMGSLPHVMERMKKDPELYVSLYQLTTQPGITTDSNRYLEADIVFHTELVKASGIEPLIVFNDLLQSFFRVFQKEVVGSDPSNMAKGVRLHQGILNALRKGELEAAEELYRVALTGYKSISSPRQMRKYKKSKSQS